MRNYQTRYEKGGLEGLIVDDQSGRMSYLSEKQQRTGFGAESKVYPTTKSVVLYVKKEFGVVYTVNGMTALLHRLGFHIKSQRESLEKLILRSRKRLFKNIKE